jgi:hypothetical protein
LNAVPLLYKEGLGEVKHREGLGFRILGLKNLFLKSLKINNLGFRIKGLGKKEKPLPASPY